MSAAFSLDIIARKTDRVVEKVVIMVIIIAQTQTILNQIDSGAIIIIIRTTIKDSIKDTTKDLIITIKHKIKGNMMVEGSQGSMEIKDLGVRLKIKDLRVRLKINMKGGLRKVVMFEINF